MNQPTWIQRYKEKFHATYPFENWLYRDMNQKLNYAMIDFIQSELSQQRKEIVEWSKQLIGKHNARILNEFQKQGTTEMPFIAYDERVCLIPAITIAMEETDDDIITKLSSTEL